jgi:uncharacterized membrane protein YjjP (DUF1212 family)
MNKMRTICEKAQGNRDIHFLLKLAKALHSYGLPAHRLEDVMAQIAGRLGYDCDFFAIPTGIFGSLSNAEGQETFFIRVQPGDANLEKQCLVDDIVNRVMNGELSPSDGVDLVAGVEALPDRYPAWLVIISFSIVSASASRFFGGGVVEALTSGFVGLVMGGLVIFTGKYPRIGRLFPLLVSFLAAFVSGSINYFFGSLSVNICLISGLIVFVPGLSLTIAMTELATGHLSSGTARFSQALVIFLQMGFGVALGTHLNSILFGKLSQVVRFPLPPGYDIVSVLVAGMAFVVLFKAFPKDFAWIVGISFLSYFGARTGAILLGPELGVSIAALSVGSAANLFARFFNRPAAVLLLPGLLLLVPGSIGFNSISSMMHQDIIMGMQTAFRMFMVAIALVSGLFLSSVLISPRKAL